MAKDYGEKFNIAHIEPLSHIYGPGQRYVVWFQGCSLACEGCWNREMWSFREKRLIHRDDLLKAIIQAPDINGVTFLGGEPLQQSSNLWWLIREIRERTNLTIFLFTGYEKEELIEKKQFSNINEFCDIVAIGRYLSNQRNINQQWIGSENQTVFYPENSREVVRPLPINQVEISINSDETVNILGFPDEDLLNNISY